MGRAMGIDMVGIMGVVDRDIEIPPIVNGTRI